MRTSKNCNPLEFHVVPLEYIIGGTDRQARCGECCKSWTGPILNGLDLTETDIFGSPLGIWGFPQCPMSLYWLIIEGLGRKGKSNLPKPGSWNSQIPLIKPYQPIFKFFNSRKRSDIWPRNLIFSRILSTPLANMWYYTESCYVI